MKPTLPISRQFLVPAPKSPSASSDSDDLSSELAPPALDYLTQVDIHHILGNLFHALASGRVSPQRASSLAYICTVLMQSQKGVHDQVRFMELTGFKFLKKELEARYPKPKSTKQTSSPAGSPLGTGSKTITPPKEG